MTNAEARSLFEQLDLDLAIEMPEDITGDVLMDIIEPLGYKLGIDLETAEWLILDQNENELARAG